MLESLLSVELLPVLVVWLVAGGVIGWRRGVGSAVTVALLVAVGPALMFTLLGERSQATEGLAALDAMTLLESVIVPLVAATLGAHIASAIAPEKEGRRAALARAHQAARAAEGLAAEIYSAGPAARGIDDKLERAHLAGIEARLRDTRRAARA